MAAQYQSAAGPSRSYPSPAFGRPGQHPVAQPPPRTDRMQPTSSSPAADWRSNGGGQSTGIGLGSMPTPNLPSMTAPSPSSYMPSPQSSTLRRDQSFSDDAAAKRNSLTDLIESEKSYVEQLTLVIRRVAGAWSRKDLPPPKLDAMFRCIEAVYRVNRSFGTKLKGVGANPSDAKALGDLLMRWVDDLEPAYGRYVAIYLTGFDSYKLVTKNPLLPGILDDVSRTCPPTPPLERWTLDALFLLPYARLRYYRKLYARLLKSTQEGRNDHRMLATASQRLETLVADVEARLECDVSEEDNPGGSAAPSGGALRDPSWTPIDRQRNSRASSAHDSSVETQSVLSSFNSRIDSTRNSATSAATSVTQSPGRASKSTAPISTLSAPPIIDLEQRIDTSRTIDLFNMQPRQCKLQMAPASLPYARSVLSSHDAIINFDPTSTGQPVVHRRAHIFILTDLFLITNRMEASEKAEMAQRVAREQPNRVGEGGPMPEMWLAYPPLAGKHLRVVEGEQSNVLAVTVMRKETFVIHAESEIERDLIMKSLQECIDFTTSPTSARARPMISTNTTTSPVETSLSPNSAGPAMRFPNPLGGPTSPISEHEMSSNISGHMSQLTLGSQDSRWSQEQALPPAANTSRSPIVSTATYPHRGHSLQNAGVGQPGKAFNPGQVISGPGYPMPSPGQMMPSSGGMMPGQHMRPGGRTPGGITPSGITPGGMAPESITPGSITPGQHMTPRQHMPGQPMPQPVRPMPPTQSRQAFGPGPGGYATPGARSDYGQGPSRSVSVHSSASTQSAMSAQSAPPVPPHHMQMQIPQPMRQVLHPSMPIPQRSATGSLLTGRQDLPPIPPYGRTPTNYSDHDIPSQHLFINPPPRSRSAEPDGLRRPEMPSAHFSAISQSSSPVQNEDDDLSPPGSPTQEIAQLSGPTVISAQMKCKIFLQQAHAQWKSLGHGKLKLYVEKGARSLKQLVVENSSGKSMIISTIVLTDGVERVGKTGVAVEISDRGQRTGIIYMIQLRNEQAANGLYDSLLAGSDRARQ